MLVRVAALSVFVASAVACANNASPSDETTPSVEKGAVDAGAASDAPALDDAAASPPPDHSAPPPRGDASDDDAGSAPKGCIDNVAVGHHVYTCGGIHMDVEIPPQCASAHACGLVVDAHGLTMDAQMENYNTNMRALGAKYGFVVVQPNANPGPPFSQWQPATDDPTLYTFIVDATSALAIDPKRVHMTGFSDGGETSFRFLCKHADLFASVAPAAGQGCTFTGTDTPSREIPVLYMHGTRDALVNFQSVATVLRDAVVTGWKMGPGATVETGTGFVRTRYTSAKGTVFEFLQHDYAADSSLLVGHCFPGSTDPGNQPGQLFPFNCVAPNAFNWGEEVMKFFVAHD